jgi:hypothetical protein
VNIQDFSQRISASIHFCIHLRGVVGICQLPVIHAGRPVAAPTSATILMPDRIKQEICSIWLIIAHSPHLAHFGSSQPKIQKNITPLSLSHSLSLSNKDQERQRR